MKQLLPTTYERLNTAEDPRDDEYIETSGYTDEYGQHYERSRCHFWQLDYYTREKLIREYKNNK